MLQSVGFSIISGESLSGVDDRPKQVDASANEGVDRLVVAVALPVLAVVKSSRLRGSASARISGEPGHEAE